MLEQAHPADRFWVLPAVGPALALAAPASVAVDALDRLEATDAGTDLTALVNEAVRLFPPGGARPREIVVMSDFQASSLGRATVGLPQDVRLVESRIEGATDNLAVVALEIDPPTPGGDGTALVRLGGESLSDADTVEVRLSVGGDVISIARVESSGSGLLRLPVRGFGEYAVSAEIPPSGLRPDDRRVAVLRLGSRPLVAHSGARESFVGQALATLQDARRLRLADEADRPEAWFVEGVPPDPLPSTERSVWILVPPEEEALTARFNAGLERLGVPWRTDVVDVSGEMTLRSTSALPGLDSIRIRGRHVLSRRGAGFDTVLVHTADGSPWLVAGEASHRRYVLLGSPLVPSHSELPVTATMLPLIEALLFRWSGLGGSLPAPVTAGGRAILPAGADSVAAPDGSRVRVDGGSPFSPLRVGVYTVFEAGGDTSLLAATVPLSETDLAAAAPGELARALDASRYVVAATERDWESSMYGTRRGAPARPYLLLLAVALVVAEATLSTPGGRRRKTRGAGPEVHAA
jgi:hypothetical protein